MRTISGTLRDRLVAEAEEAETQGLVKVAENLTRQIERSEVRSSAERYVYSNADFTNDVQTALWDIVVRAADFHGKHIDAAKAQKIVNAAADNMIQELRTEMRVQHGVGEFEPPVPGETKEEIAISVDDDE